MKYQKKICEERKEKKPEIGEIIENPLTKRSRRNMKAAEETSWRSTCAGCLFASPSEENWRYGLKKKLIGTNLQKAEEIEEAWLSEARKLLLKYIISVHISKKYRDMPVSLQWLPKRKHYERKILQTLYIERHMRRRQRTGSCRRGEKKATWRENCNRRPAACGVTRHWRHEEKAASAAASLEEVEMTSEISKRMKKRRSEIFSKKMKKKMKKLTEENQLLKKKRRKCLLKTACHSSPLWSYRPLTNDGVLKLYHEEKLPFVK